MIIVGIRFPKQLSIDFHELVESFLLFLSEFHTIFGNTVDE